METAEFVKQEPLSEGQSISNINTTDIQQESLMNQSNDELLKFMYKPTPIVKSPPKPRKFLTLQEKLSVIQYSEETKKSQRQIAAAFNICKTNVHEILKHKEDIRAIAAANDASGGSVRTKLKKQMPYENSQPVPIQPLVERDSWQRSVPDNHEEEDEAESDTLKGTSYEATSDTDIIELNVDENDPSSLQQSENDSDDDEDYVTMVMPQAGEEQEKDKMNAESRKDVQTTPKRRNRKSLHPKSFKSAELNVEDKLRLILSCKGKSQIELAREFRISPFEVFEILRDRDEIEDMYMQKRQARLQLAKGNLEQICNTQPRKKRKYTRSVKNTSITSDATQQGPDETASATSTQDNPETVISSVISNIAQTTPTEKSDQELYDYLDDHWNSVEEYYARESAKKRKRTAISLEDKMVIIKFKGVQSLQDTADAFGIGKTTVLDIFKRSDEITKAYQDQTLNPQRKRIKSWKGSKNFAKIDHVVYTWYREMLDKGVMLTGPKIQKQAAALAAKLGETKFKASNGWLYSFYKRHNLGWKWKAKKQEITKSGNEQEDAAGRQQLNNSENPTEIANGNTEISLKSNIA